ncbi:DUF2303 family protein [Novosphingobium sp. NBM11]|uniref:DUF2303 family protein n=1 Tax=Novosphingobium sp. NBM11 TaxID=2596914 RepID=UPI0018923A2A|nr:DUF2303 family protein [Novosphingobium sp. NBM11]MBF5091935.1 DUF2303 family protein [Novosphingobium sp. NBM11]
MENVETEHTATDQAAEQQAATQPTTAAHYNHNFSHDIVREQIADRTGDLLRAAMSVSDEHLRAQAGMIRDPRDGTEAHFQITKNGISRIPAESFDEYRLFPLYRKGVSVHTRLESFIALVSRFAGVNSAIFANESPTTPSLTAVFDYHPDNTDVSPPDADGTPFVHPVQALRHRARYAFPLSDEWQAWYKNNGVVMAVAEFASFLEDHIVDVSADDLEDFSPGARKFVQANRGELATPTKLFEIARGLKIYEKSVVKEVRNLSSGEVQITFDSEHTDGDGKPLSLPTMFSIVIPVFARSDVADRLIAKFRYRKTDAGIKFWYELWRPDLTFQAAFDDACTKVTEDTGLPLYHGAPEQVSA